MKANTLDFYKSVFGILILTGFIITKGLNTAQIHNFTQRKIKIFIFHKTKITKLSSRIILGNYSLPRTVRRDENILPNYTNSML